MQVIVRRLKVRWMDDCLSDRPVIKHHCVAWLNQSGCDPHPIQFCPEYGLWDSVRALMRILPLTTPVLACS